MGYEAHRVGIVVCDLAAIPVLHGGGGGGGVGIAHGLLLLGLVLVARRRQVVRQEERRRGTLGRGVGGQRLVVKNLSKAHNATVIGEGTIEPTMRGRNHPIRDHP